MTMGLHLGHVEIRLFGVMAAMGMSLWVGCNPFTTRQPEPPETEKRTPVRNPVSSIDVLYNLRATCENLSPTQYLETLSEDFVFVPDPEDSVNFSNAFPPGQVWDKARETVFAHNFLNDRTTQSIQFKNWPPDLVESSTDGRRHRYEYKYDVIIDHLRNAPKAIQGISDLFLREEEDGHWTLYRWRDERISAVARTWGELRARF